MRENGVAWDPASKAKRIHVPTYEEILEKIKGRYPKGRRDPYELEIARLQTVYNIAISKTSFIRDLLALLDSLHPFFWELIRIEFDERELRSSIKCIAKARKLAGKFWEKYRYYILASETPREAKKASAEGRGRILSPFKRCRKALDTLRSLVVFLSRLPAVDPTLPTVIVAGAPSTGKSTFIRSVSRAKPRVSPYPFTTTQVHVGHARINDDVVQVIDTPGLLDRPPEEMNPTERKAVAALSLLEGPILLLVDVSPSAVLDVESQFRVLEYLRSYIRDKTVYLGINKVDDADPAYLERARELSEEAIKAGKAVAYYTLSAIDPESALNVLRDIARTSGLLRGSD